MFNLHELVVYLQVVYLWVRQNNCPPPKTVTSQSSDTVNMLTYMLKGTLQMWLPLTALKWGNYPELSWWVQFNLIIPWEQRIFSGCRDSERWERCGLLLLAFKTVEGIQILLIYPRQMKAYVQTVGQTFIAALFEIAKTTGSKPNVHQDVNRYTNCRISIQ